MNYYDYRGYFQDIEDLNRDILNEIQLQRNDINQNHTELTEQLHTESIFISAILVITLAMRIIFK